jgi:hypothetical protein
MTHAQQQQQPPQPPGIPPNLRNEVDDTDFLVQSILQVAQSVSAHVPQQLSQEMIREQHQQAKEECFAMLQAFKMEVEKQCEVIPWALERSSVDVHPVLAGDDLFQKITQLRASAAAAATAASTSAAANSSGSSSEDQVYNGSSAIGTNESDKESERDLDEVSTGSAAASDSDDDDDILGLKSLVKANQGDSDDDDGDMKVKSGGDDDDDDFDLYGDLSAGFTGAGDDDKSMEDEEMNEEMDIMTGTEDMGQGKKNAGDENEGGTTDSSGADNLKVGLESTNNVTDKVDRMLPLTTNTEIPYYLQVSTLFCNGVE